MPLVPSSPVATPAFGATGRAICEAGCDPPSAFRHRSIPGWLEGAAYARIVVSQDDLARAERLPDGSLILERADSDAELEAEAQVLGDAGWQMVSRCERPGQTTVVTWAKNP